MDTYLCPKGHQSTEPDYCSECGAKMQAAAPAPVQSAPANIAEHCPDCGTPRDPDIAFCEICGYDFVTGAHGDLSAVPPPLPAAPLAAAPLAEPEAEPAAAPVPPGSGWTATLGVDPALQEPGSPAPPEGVGPFTFPLVAPVSLIGRRSEARGIFPEIPVQHDDAVSHRHALLQLDPAGALTLRDIGSSNGTRLNGAEITRLVDCPLKDGDVIAFGHWSTLTVSHLANGTSQPGQA